MVLSNKEFFLSDLVGRQLKRRKILGGDTTQMSM